MSSTTHSTMSATERQASPTFSAGVPKYVAVADFLQQALADSVYLVGDRLPSEREMAEQWGITQMTVRQGLEVLRQKDLIDRRQGQGTFVKAQQPSDAASALTRKTKSIYILGLSPSRSPRNVEVNWQPRLRRFQGVVDAAFRHGIMLQSDLPIDASAPPAQLVESLAGAGGLIMHDEILPQEVLGGLLDRGVACVAINCYMGVSYCNHVLVDSQRGAMLGVRHLIEQGHRKIAIIVGEPSRFSMGQRLQGYRDAHRLHGIPVRDEYVVVEPRGTGDDAAQACARLLALPDPPSAVFTVSDRRAVGILEAAGDLGISVPRDLSVLGFDDLPEAELTTPPLTTLHNPLYASGGVAVDLLVEQMASDSKAGQTRLLDSPLICRESVSPHTHD